MFSEIRTDIYDYLYNLFYDVVTKNVYSMSEPQELTKSDTTDGFIVIRVGDTIDESEFALEAYGSVRVFIWAYIPPKSRGRLDKEKYRTMETSIDNVVRQAMETPNANYYISDANALSMDMTTTSNANNLFYIFVKSFIVNLF